MSLQIAFIFSQYFLVLSKEFNFILQLLYSLFIVSHDSQVVLLQLLNLLFFLADKNFKLEHLFLDFYFFISLFGYLDFELAGLDLHIALVVVLRILKLSQFRM